MQSGLVFNIQHYSVHDGPGIRTTVFLKGCPLRCAWCHNPEGLWPGKEIMVIETRCIGCGECREACPNGGPASGSGPLAVRPDGCSLCGACCEACPADARRMMGRTMTVRQVLEAVVQDRVFFEDSGGGVTFSGGEPLHQLEFLRALLWASRAHRLHTAVDTSGMAATSALLSIAPLTDLFLYDLKVMEENAHAHYTGVSNRLILENLAALGQVHNNIWVRVPLVPGVNDNGEALEAAAQFAARIPGVRQVNVLPFHRTGAHKFQRLGRNAGFSERQPPPPAALAEAVGIFQDAGLNTFAGG